MCAVSPTKDNAGCLAHTSFVPILLYLRCVLGLKRKLTLNVVTVSQTTKLLLTSSVPTVEDDGTEVGVEVKGVDLDTESS